MAEQNKRPIKLWVLLIAGPLLFLAGILVMSVVYGIAGKGQNVDQIPTLVANSTPYQLVVIQLLLLWYLVAAAKKEGLSLQSVGLALGAGQQLWKEILWGILPGALLALVYLKWLSPMLVWLQTQWDYVPAGDLMSTLGSAIVPFAIADVLLAPFVEELIYRGVALPRLMAKYPPAVALLLGCLAFGLLHWTGGFWYVLLVGLVAGGLFSWLRLQLGNLIAPIAAHLALNLIETIYILNFY